MKPDELRLAIESHALWLRDEPGGKRANLSSANLYGANLYGANLIDANLSSANLYGANLYGANLIDANLSRANLSRANLSRANLSRANLSRANLSSANLSRANLSSANLIDANLYDADLSDTNLYGANLSRAKSISDLAVSQVSILPAGRLIVWKKCRGDVVVKLAVPEDARRSNATGRKCRAERVEVLAVFGGDVGVSLHDGVTKYRVGEVVACDRWCEDRWVECGGGIHFFITREEAEAYTG